MKLVFIRHGEPNYENDSLTERGKIEAIDLADRLAKVKPSEILCSPLGRAKETAFYTLNKLGMEASILPWLEEFKGRCIKPSSNGELDFCWNWLPSDFAKQPLFFAKDEWKSAAEFSKTNIVEEWTKVKEGMDSFLEQHGYKRNSLVYDVLSPNSETVYIFCHLAIQAVIISYLTNLPVFPMLQAFTPAPSSITTLVTEERIKGTACFKILSYGDISHLYRKDHEPSFAGRFCECFNES